MARLWSVDSFSLSSHLLVASSRVQSQYSSHTAYTRSSLLATPRMTLRRRYTTTSTCPTRSGSCWACPSARLRKRPRTRLRTSRRGAGCESSSRRGKYRACVWVDLSVSIEIIRKCIIWPYVWFNPYSLIPLSTSSFSAAPTSPALAVNCTHSSLLVRVFSASASKSALWNPVRET